MISRLRDNNSKVSLSSTLYPVNLSICDVSITFKLVYIVFTLCTQYDWLHNNNTIVFWHKILFVTRENIVFWHKMFSVTNENIVFFAQYWLFGTMIKMLCYSNKTSFWFKRNHQRYHFSLIYQRHLSKLIKVGKMIFLIFAGDICYNIILYAKPHPKRPVIIKVEKSTTLLCPKNGHCAQTIFLLLSAHWIRPLWTKIKQNL